MGFRITCRYVFVTGLIPEWKLAKSISGVTTVKIEFMKIWVKRATSAACAAVTCAVVVSSCALTDSSNTGAAAAIDAFATALSRQDAGGAANHTTAPGQAGETLTTTLRAMSAQQVDVDVDNPVEYSDGTATFEVTTKWTWGKDREFEASSEGTARKLSSGWKVTWDPAILHPGLTAGGHLREIRTDATPAPSVRSRSGKVFMHLEPIHEIVIDPARARDLPATVRAVAGVIAPIAPLITADVISAELAANPGKPVVAVALREPDLQVLAGDPAKITGVSVKRTERLVMADRRLSSPLEDGLTNYWQAIRDATAGWQVQLVNPGDRPRKLAGEQGPPGPDVLSTVDQGVQLTLGDAAVEVGQPATILALDAQTGAILGMAQNTYAADREIDIDKPYPVGKTLDPVFDAIGRLSESQPERAETLLDKLGLGVQFTVPGASVPTADQPGITTIGYRPNQTNMSMANMGALGVALARAAAGDPSSVPPFVLKNVPTKVTGGELGALEPALVAPILKAMTATATTGDASDLTRAPGLKALVGTNGPQGPGWFVGIQGGKVIVIYTEGEKSGTAALQVAQKYFTIK
ncbi:putative penicillin-binding protein [Gordonia paraffinivorans NBRC 108238]|uniref:Penicillin-binding protein n=2 Tax=Gordonia paraffinivorans TaxID=175628 RepID=A0ABQ0IR97_9ACTN|nr:putative penicillin-binding protein [Gordonia paraffinivorans NBRC 108238]